MIKQWVWQSKQVNQTFPLFHLIHAYMIWVSRRRPQCHSDLQHNFNVFKETEELLSTCCRESGVCFRYFLGMWLTNVDENPLVVSQGFGSLKGTGALFEKLYLTRF